MTPHSKLSRQHRNIKITNPKKTKGSFLLKMKECQALGSRAFYKTQAICDYKNIDLVGKKKNLKKVFMFVS